ncbi:AraC family transcriptional regulator [Thioclava sp. GXIMD4216]|uniref:AraC family transcriptional regulator n=1 Tax=Thioclava sp. GXIMD4216 TaxID=3131929 RepID=UPI0030CE93F1
MSIHRYPGNFRVGVLDEPRAAVLETGVSMLEPKVMVFILLSGYQRFRLATQRCVLDAAQGPAGLLLRINRPLEHQFEENHGAPLTKISIAVSTEWVDGLAPAPPSASPDPAEHSPPPAGAKRADLWVQPFVPAPQSCDLAQAIRSAPSPMQRMSLGLTLLDRVLAASARSAAGEAPPLTGPTGTSGPIPPPDLLVPDLLVPDPLVPAHPLLDRLRREMRKAPARTRTAPALAKACGIGLRTLERQVQQDTGRGLGAVLRRERLLIGFHALSRGMPVMQAASAAGYQSRTSFGSALKREFGLSPAQILQQAARQIW